MRLTKGNIKFVKRLELDGVTYAWYVGMKSNRISDGREFMDYVGSREDVKAFDISRLPATVRSFIREHEEKVFADGGTSGFVEYMIG